MIARFSPDGQTIVTGGRTDGLIKLWDRSTVRMNEEFRASEENLENAVFSPDGRLLASVGQRTITLWSPSDRKEIATIPAAEAVQGVAFSHDGTKLATASEGAWSIELWDVSTGRRLREFRGHTEGVFSVAFSADDRTIVSTSSDQTIRLWDVATGQERGTWLGHTAKVWNLAVSPDGRTIASASQDGSVKVWDIRSQQDLEPLPIPVPVTLGFSKDSRTLMSFELGRQSSVARWDVRSGSPLERTPVNLTGSYSCSAFSSDADLLAIADEDGAIAIHDLATRRRWKSFGPAMRNVNSMLFSVNHRYLAVSSRSGRQLWDVQTDRMIPFPWTNVGGVIFTFREEIVCDLSEGRVGWWDPQRGQSIIGDLKPRRSIACLTMSREGKLLATVNPYGRKISLWSAETFELRKEMPGNRIGIGPLAFSPDGKTLASAGGDDLVKLWDVATGDDILTLDGFHGPVGMLRFSPDGKSLATISSRGANQPREVILWHTAGDDTVPAGAAGSTASK